MISVASLFNYVSMRRAISNFWIFNNKCKEKIKNTREFDLLAQILETQCIQDQFCWDRENGPILVNVFIPESTIKEYPPEYFEMPEAKEYIDANPKYKEGYDLAYTFPFDFINVMGLTWRIIKQNSRA